MAMSVVNELLKNEEEQDTSYDTQKGLMQFITWDRRSVKLYLELFYFILILIEDYDLEDKKILRDLLIVEMTDDEREFFYIEAVSDEDKLKLL